MSSSAKPSPAVVQRLDTAIKEYLTATGTDPVMAGGCVNRSAIPASVQKQLEPGFVIGLISPEAGKEIQQLVEGRKFALQKVPDVGTPSAGKELYSFFNIPDRTPVSDERLTALAEKVEEKANRLKHPVSHDESVALIVKTLDGVSAVEALNLLREAVRKAESFTDHQKAVLDRKFASMIAPHEEIAHYR